MSARPQVQLLSSWGRTEARKLFFWIRWIHYFGVNEVEVCVCERVRVCERVSV